MLFAAGAKAASPSIIRGGRGLLRLTAFFSVCLPPTGLRGMVKGAGEGVGARGAGVEEEDAYPAVPAAEDFVGVFTGWASLYLLVLYSRYAALERPIASPTKNASLLLVESDMVVVEV